jgi:hypothetical protein
MSRRDASSLVTFRKSGQQGTNSAADDALMSVQLRQQQHSEAETAGWDTTHLDRSVAQARRELRRELRRARSPLRRVLAVLRPLRRDRRPSGGRPAARPTRRAASARAGPFGDPDPSEPPSPAALVLARTLGRDSAEFEDLFHRPERRGP